MTKARDLANFVSAGNPLADGTINVADITDLTATAAELNVLDGITADVNELNILDGVTSTTAELNILDGVTSTTAELNILDGVTADANELNILDGVTSTTAELNLLDGSAAATVTNSKAVIYGASGEIVATQVDITATGDLRLQDTTGGQYVALQAPGTVSASYTLTLPDADGSADQVLKTNGSGSLSFVDQAGGAWELISSSSMFGSTTFVDISLPTGYKIYKLYLRGLDPNGSRKLSAYLFSGSVGSPSFYSVCSYHFANWLYGTLADNDVTQVNGYAEIVSQGVSADDGDGGAWGEILIFRPDSINDVQPYLQSYIGYTISGTPEVIGGQQITTATYYNTATDVPEMVGIRLSYEGIGFVQGSYYLVGLSI